MKVPDGVIRSARFQSMTGQEQLAIQRLWLIEDAEIREGMRADRHAPVGFTMTEVGWWCAQHGYGCEPSACPCGHTLRCDCRSIADEH